VVVLISRQSKLKLLFSDAGWTNHQTRKRYDRLADHAARKLLEGSLKIESFLFMY
jgi:hypothetical protein